MFAFALWDEPRRRLLIARDPLGQKPLFYSPTADGLLFASEIKALLCADGVHAALDPAALSHYLSLRFVPPPATMFEGIRKLPAGHRLVFEDGTLRTERYWRLRFDEKLRIADGEAIEEIRAALDRAVTSHLMSDVPLGAFLSGGMDSSTIVAIAARAQQDPLLTFAIGVDQQSFDELPHARQVAEHVGTRHIEERVEADLITSLPAMIHHLDEPSDPIAACQYHAAALAARHVKVALGGDGGDEVFGGFDRYAGVGWVGAYARLPRWLREGVLGRGIAAIPENLDYKSWTQRLRWLDQLGRAPDADRLYAEATIFFRFGHEAKGRVLGGELWPQVAGLDSADVIVDALRRAGSEDRLDRMLYADFETRLPEHSLMLSDRMSMAHGLEVRSPLLDRALVELMARMPRRLKIRGRSLKVALRRAMQGELPPAILERPKQGFMFPVAQWLRGPLHGFARQLFERSRAAEAGVLRTQGGLELLDEHRAGRADHHVRIWMLLNVELWYRLYAEGTPPEHLREEMLRDLRDAA